MTNPKPPLGNIQNAMELGKMVANQRKAQGLTQSVLAGLAQTGTRFWRFVDGRLIGLLVV